VELNCGSCLCFSSYGERCYSGAAPSALPCLGAHLSPFFGCWVLGFGFRFEWLRLYLLSRWVSLQRDGGALASASGYRVSVFGSPEITLCANGRKPRSISVRALHQLRSSSDSVSRAICFLNFWMRQCIDQYFVACIPSTLTKGWWDLYVYNYSAPIFDDFMSDFCECGRRWFVRRVYCYFYLRSWIDAFCSSWELWNATMHFEYHDILPWTSLPSMNIQPKNGIQILFVHNL